MKKIMIAVLVVLAAAVAVESHAAADDAIKQVFVELDRCLANNDARCVGELFVEAGTFLAPTSGDKIVKGKAQIVKTLKDLMGAPAPNMKGVSKMHSVENVRLIDDDHAVVDASVAARTKPGGDQAGAPGGAYHAVAFMVRVGGKWMFEDMRSYAVTTAVAPQMPGATAGPATPAATATPGTEQ
jgi:uncharacterized protein (TIGR02246 family)